MNPARRSLCIVSRDPVQCSELVLSLQASLDPDDEVEIVMDRRRPRDVFEADPDGPDERSGGRRRNPDVDLAVRTKGFAIVPSAPMTEHAAAEPDSDDRARFENILSFRRRREPRSGRAVGAASAPDLRGTLEAYEARIDDATGRALSSAMELIDRVKSDAIGNAPTSAGSGADPVPVRRRLADSP